MSRQMNVSPPNASAAKRILFTQGEVFRLCRFLPRVTLIQKDHFHLLPRHSLHLLTECSHLGPFLFTGRRYCQGQQMPQ